MVKVENEKPPAEPPPSLEYNAEEMNLYVMDVTSCAESVLAHATTDKIAQLYWVKYTLFATARQSQKNVV